MAFRRGGVCCLPVDPNAPRAMNAHAFALALCFATAAARQDVTVAYRPQLMYAHTSPLRIYGSGFAGSAVSGATDSQYYSFDYSLEFMPPLTGAHNVTVSSDSVLSLSLERGERWLDVRGDAEQGAAVSLVSLGLNGAELLTAPAPVATILATPTVKRGADRVVDMSVTPHLVINGTGFTRTTALTFDPPLARDVDCILQVRSAELLRLTLKSGRSWRSDRAPGPLNVTRIDTGGGELLVRAASGVTVATVRASPRNVTPDAVPPLGLVARGTVLAPIATPTQPQVAEAANSSVANLRGAALAPVATVISATPISTTPVSPPVSTPISPLPAAEISVSATPASPPVSTPISPLPAAPISNLRGAISTPISPEIDLSWDVTPITTPVQPQATEATAISVAMQHLFTYPNGPLRIHGSGFTGKIGIHEWL